MSFFPGTCGKKALVVPNPMGVHIRSGRFKSWFDMPWVVPNTPPDDRMDRVAFLTEFLLEIRIGVKQDFPWLTENRRRLVGGLDRSERDVPRSGEAR